MKEPRRPRNAVDEGLLDACRKGDRAALERVYREHAPMLHRLLVRLLGNAADADDVLQTTLVQASRAFARFRGEAAVDTWLSRIAINAARSYMRSAQVPVRATLELVGDEAETHAQSPEDIIHDRQRIARLHHHLAALSPAKRIAFVLSVIEGMPVEEIAAMTGATVFATKSRIYWAGRALRARARKDALLRDLLVDEPEGDE